jgi:hypothetical protein
VHGRHTAAAGISVSRRDPRLDSTFAGAFRRGSTSHSGEIEQLAKDWGERKDGGF